ncbi:MAG: hypothetical protein K0Q59_5334, partial [Paenibacillus sp.]|nr:hypothetical protein [Paenibacillus sp.]
ESRYRLCAFLAKTLQLAPAADMADDTADCLDAAFTCYEAWPANARTTDEISALLSGIEPQPNRQLWDVYPPQGDCADSDAKGQRGEYRQIFAQYEAFLRKR